MAMERLVDHLVAIGALKTEKYIEVFRRLDRKLFMWPGYEDEAYLDSPSLLGETGQTISAPHMHAYYLEYSGVSEDDVVMEVGVGSGYLSALIGLLIKMYGGRGHVYGLEYDPRLYSFARTNISRVGLEDQVTVILANGYWGWPPREERELYDVILVSAAVDTPPQYLLAQLREGGRMVIPVGPALYQELRLYMKRGGAIEYKPLFPVSFVKMKGYEGGSL